MQRSELTVDLGAVRRNVKRLLDAAGGAEVWAVVKANGYGHGAVPVARAALDGGASWLAVALVEEGVELREAGIAAVYTPKDWNLNGMMRDIIELVAERHGIISTIGA